MGRFSKYNPSLSPDIEYLSDRAVIIQAWKKSHEYIRRHNWYSENLELDISCICLEKFCDDWCTVFTRSNRTSFRPTPMRVVPAPKPAAKQDERWKVDAEGKFSSKGELGIRPLAHIPIKDQTIGMVFLMCLANIVENIQGMPVPYSKDIKNLTASYGNRLLCTWNYSQTTKKAKSFYCSHQKALNQEPKIQTMTLEQAQYPLKYRRVAYECFS